jgi:hypothetical protein
MSVVGVPSSLQFADARYTLLDVLGLLNYDVSVVNGFLGLGGASSGVSSERVSCHH